MEMMVVMEMKSGGGAIIGMKRSQGTCLSALKIYFNMIKKELKNYFKKFKEQYYEDNIESNQWHGSFQSGNTEHLFLSAATDAQ